LLSENYHILFFLRWIPVNLPEKITMSITLNPIGIIHTPFTAREGMPIQPSGAIGIKGFIELNEAFVPGLQDLDDFSHIMLIYVFHQSSGYDLLTTPFLDQTQHGVFATRVPRRPNPLGFSIVKLLDISGNILNIEEVDMLDGTPLLDIKPYVPAFDIRAMAKPGWTSGKTVNLNEFRSDGRFS
jgi:tRNA (adenine37-N6)-methyltransferase